MTARVLLMRSAGAFLLGGGLGCCLWSRELMLGASHDLTGMDVVLLLSSFMLTIVGTSLVLSKGGIGRSRDRQNPVAPAKAGRDSWSHISN